ncbi:retrovirus-related pol polyprotein from transposon TNT 1-94 [Tanacetum coccineum]
MDVKSAFLYGKIEEEVYVCQPPGFEDPDFPDRIYKVEKALYGLHQAPITWYETLSTYQLDNEFQKGKIDKTLFIKRYKGDILLVQVYANDIIFGSTKKELCNAFEKLMHEKFQMSSIGELTFFLGLQVKQKKDGIFISQDKYVAEILKKFRFTEVKTASTPMDTQKPLLKDKDGEEVDVYMYRSIIGSLMYLTSSRLDIMFAVCAYARYQVNPKVSHLHAVKRIFRYLKGQLKLGLWYPKDSPFDLVAYTDSDYAGASLDRKSTTGGKAKKSVRLIVGKLFEMELELMLDLVDEKKVIITESIVRRDLQLEDEEGVDCLPNATIFKQLALMGPKTTWNEFSSTMASIIICLATNQKFNFSKFIFESMIRNLENVSGKFLMYPRKPKRKYTQVPQPSGPTEHVADEAVHKELGDSLVRAATTASSLEADDKDRLKLDELVELCTNLQKKVLDLEKTKTTQANEIASLKRRVKKLEQKKRSRTHRHKRLRKVGAIARVESSGDEEDLGEDASKQGKRINAIDADEDITLVSIQDDADKEMFDVETLNGEEVFVAGQNENVVEEDKGLSQDKGKGILVEIEKPLKKKDQLKLDEEIALKLQAGIDEEERISIAGEENSNEANIAWDDIQAKVDANYQLAERLQAKEQEQFTIKEKTTLFKELLEQRRKHFAAKRVEEKMNKPPTKTQQKKIMITYLKNMEGWKHKDLKSKDFDSIKELFNKAFTRVNMFVDFRTELVEGSSKRAGIELEQEITKKQKVDDVQEIAEVGDDQEAAKIKELIEIVPDEEEIEIDAIPLAVKSPGIVD